jgi:hypothetical protein
MNLRADTPTARLVVLGVVVLVYFVVFPADLKDVLAPIVALLEMSKAVLELTKSVSAALYGVIAVGIVAWTVVRVWGGRKPGAGAAA